MEALFKAGAKPKQNFEAAFQERPTLLCALQQSKDMQIQWVSCLEKDRAHQQNKIFPLDSGTLKELTPLGCAVLQGMVNLQLEWGASKQETHSWHRKDVPADKLLQTMKGEEKEAEQ